MVSRGSPSLMLLMLLRMSFSQIVGVDCCSSENDNFVEPVLCLLFVFRFLDDLIFGLKTVGGSISIDGGVGRMKAGLRWPGSTFGCTFLVDPVHDLMSPWIALV